ncbi:MAG: hypothetical protein IJB14_06065 [Firmicutes bacterium]|nr:hypothetical protein [Bacillota bacterium]
MEKKLIFITGFFGAPLLQRAQQLAEEHDLPLISLDEEIEKADGRPVRRICMMMGEHEYRNKEYEALKKLTECALEEAAGDETPRSDAVVLCGDGVLHDDMSRDLITSHQLIVLGGDMSCDELWENAKTIEGSCHAFMHFGNEEEKRAAFDDLYERQRVLFTPYI